MINQSDYYDIQDQIMASEERRIRRERFAAPDLVEDPIPDEWKDCEQVNEDGTRKK